MATIYRKVYPVPMPDGAEVFVRRRQRIAQWVDGNGNVKTAPVARNGKKVLHEAGCWYARYRNAEGRDCRVSTECQDEQTARKVLADLLAEVEKVKAGIMTAVEVQTAKHVERPITEHVEDYLEYLRTKRVRGRKVSDEYRRNIRSRLMRVAKEAGLRRLTDVGQETMIQWLEQAESANMAAATRNEYLASMVAFCNWAKKTHRLMANPLTGMEKADCSGDRRHVRRALTADEVGRLLCAARIRPVAEVGRRPQRLPDDQKAGRGTWTYEPLTAENLDACHAWGLARLDGQRDRQARIERLGRERALFYLLAVSTGLRRKELGRLTTGQVHLDAVPRPYIELLAEQAKSGRGAHIPLRADVVEELQAFLAERGDGLPFGVRLFRCPPTIRVFDADLQAAGIAKTDARGWVVDIHALRHTFGTHLSAAGVHPRTAMAAMRHSRIELTMNYYTDPVLLDVAGAVEALPSFAHSATAQPAAPRRAVRA
jgi:site-specific recombinase XerC